MLFGCVYYEKVLVFIGIFLYMLKIVTLCFLKKRGFFFFVHRIAGLGGLADVPWRNFVDVGEIFTEKVLPFRFFGVPLHPSSGEMNT